MNYHKSTVLCLSTYTVRLCTNHSVEFDKMWPFKCCCFCFPASVVNCLLLFEFHLVGFENSQTPSRTTVWPSDHREDYMSCAWPFNSLVRLFPKHCTLTNKAVWTIWRALSKPPQRRQGPDLCPLWLLVGTPSAIRPELAFRRVEHSLPYSDVAKYIFDI